jgi:hypothetical protein
MIVKFNKIFQQPKAEASFMVGYFKRSKTRSNLTFAELESATLENWREMWWRGAHFSGPHWTSTRLNYRYRSTTFLALEV